MLMAGWGCRLFRNNVRRNKLYDREVLKLYYLPSILMVTKILRYSEHIARMRHDKLTSRKISGRDDILYIRNFNYYTQNSPR